MPHLKRLAAPRTWKIERKTKKWGIKVSPGPHPVQRSISLLSIIRDYLGYANKAKEARYIIGNGQILVDNIPRKDYKFPCGLMDVISISKTNENFRILLDAHGFLRVIPIPKENATWKLCRIENKTIINGGKTQLNLHDGKNVIETGDYTTGDVLKISLPKQELLGSIQLTKGNLAMIIGGKHIGHIAEIQEIEKTHGPQPNLVHLKEFSTIKSHVFPIGKNKPEITIPTENIL
jgi:small subunit ribosomal protein S4e